jgi:hypothetical protein
MTTAAELAEISDALHDEWFLIDRLEHDAERAELRLPIYAGRWKKRWFGWIGEPLEDPPPPPMATLVVGKVTSVSVDDGAEIGSYTVNRLVYDATSGELRVVSNVPCEIVMQCQELDVELVRA